MKFTIYNLKSFNKFRTSFTILRQAQDKYSNTWIYYLLLVTCYSLLVIFSPTVWAADEECVAPDIKTDFACLKFGDVNMFTTTIYSVGLSIIGGVALLFIIWGGYLILTSQGDIQKLQKGKSYIVSSILGILLAVGGFVFYQIVAVDVLKIPGFK